MQPLMPIRTLILASARPRDAASVCPSMQARVIGVLPDLRRYAQSLARHRENGEDLVQDSVVRMLAAADRFDPDTNLRAWAFTIMRNLFLSNCRSPRSRLLCLDDVESGLAGTPPAQTRGLELADLRGQLALLPHAARSQLALAAEGRTYQALALADGCAVGTVKSRVHRARAALRRQLSAAYGMDAPAASGGAARLAAAPAAQPCAA